MSLNVGDLIIKEYDKLPTDVGYIIHIKAHYKCKILWHSADRTIPNPESIYIDDLISDIRSCYYKHIPRKLL